MNTPAYRATPNADAGNVTTSSDVARPGPGQRGASAGAPHPNPHPAADTCTSLPPPTRDADDPSGKARACADARPHDEAVRCASQPDRDSNPGATAIRRAGPPRSEPRVDKPRDDIRVARRTGVLVASTVRRMLARLAVVLAGLAALLGLTAAPAWAHAGGLNPTDARSTVTGFTPRQPGVTAVAVNNGTQLEVRVPGQPVARVAVPVVQVSADTKSRTWQVPVRTGAGAFVVRGRTEYVPGPNPWPWAGLMLVLAVPGYLFARSRWWRAGLAACIVAATAANLIHAVGSALAVSGQSFFWLFVGASGVGLVTWPLAVVAVVAAAMRRQFVAFAATLIGAMLVVAGFPDVDSFRRSQLPFAWPPNLDRLLVAVTLGVGLGLAIGGIAALHRHLVVDAQSEPESEAVADTRSELKEPSRTDPSKRPAPDAASLTASPVTRPGPDAASPTADPGPSSVPDPAA